MDIATASAAASEAAAASTTPDLPPPSLRFRLELEFVQSLSSVRYVSFLANGGYLEDQAFLEFLHYLQYWKRPEYVIFLDFPSALKFLDLILENPDNFRVKIRDENEMIKFHQIQAGEWIDRSRTFWGEGGRNCLQDQLEAAKAEGNEKKVKELKARIQGVLDRRKTLGLEVDGELE